MKKIKFEKVESKLSSEELNYIKGGIRYGEQKPGDTEGGDTWGNGAWQADPNGDTRIIHFN